MGKIKAPQFKTVADEHIELAEVAVFHLHGQGHTIQIEPASFDYPNTPTLRARRQRATLFVEVRGNVDRKRLSEWCKYAGAQPSETRIALVVPDMLEIDAVALAFLTESRIGLFHLKDGKLNVAIPTHDLTMKIELPDLATRSQRVRACLAPVFEKFQAGGWKDAFTDACFELEEVARRHLKVGITNTRITVLDKKGQPLVLTNKQIDKLTLGQLAGHFENIQAPNEADHALSQALTQVNTDRVAQTHHKRKKVTDTRLRKNVGKMMWLITGVMEKVLK